MIQLVIIWGLIVLFILQPETAHDGAEQGAMLFVQALLPYLLPYIILTQWLLKMPSQNQHEKRRWLQYTKAYLLGSFGGFPVGAVTVSEMKKNGELTRQESSLLLAACHAPGPMFIIGFIGNDLFHHPLSGWQLLIAIHSVNFLFFLFVLWQLRHMKPTSSLQQEESPILTSKAPLLDAIKDSSSVILLVATTVIFFSSLGTVLTAAISAAFPIDLGITKTILLALFEMTSGVYSATAHLADEWYYRGIIAAIIAFNGFSIHIQVYVIAKTANISLIPYCFSIACKVILIPLLFFLIS